MEMTIKIASLITSSLSFIGVIFIIYNHFRKPDEDASKNIALMQQGCQLKHESLDKDISAIYKSIESISRTFSLFQKNEFKHIEDRMGALEKGQTVITTILDERLPKK
ncbi:MAG: hypothetical protein EOL95_10930 [Bacteroidia bacterium]|nr:hypothetical protein [Bacteroidia bacterium]